MSRLLNREDVKKKFIKMLVDFRCDLNNYDTEVYLKRIEGKGGVLVTDPGEGDVLIYTDKAHTERPIDVVAETKTVQEIMELLDTTKGTVCKKYSEKHSLDDEVTDEILLGYIGEVYATQISQLLREIVENDEGLEEEAEELLRKVRI